VLLLRLVHGVPFFLYDDGRTGSTISPPHSRSRRVWGTPRLLLALTRLHECREHVGNADISRRVPRKHARSRERTFSPAAGRPNGRRARRASVSGCLTQSVSCLPAGMGTRVGADGKQAYLPLAGRIMVSWSVDAVARTQEIDRTVLVFRRGERELAELISSAELGCATVGNSSKALTPDTVRSSTYCGTWRPTSNRATSTSC